MTRASSASSISLEVAEQAMFWYLELLEPSVSEQAREACRAWRQAHPLHEQAWQRAENLGRRMSEMRQHQPLASATLSGSPSRRRVIKQLALLLVAGATTWGVRETGLVQPLLADYHSGVGERRTLVLGDDLKVLLNTDTAINVELEARRIRLLRGEMLVTSARGIRIDTEQGAVDLRRGRVSLRQRAGYIQVALLEGEARIHPDNAAASVILPDDRLSFTDREVFARHRAVSELAWADGMIVADEQRLADFLEELSRYRRGHLSCDPSLADLRVSGTFPLDDTDRVLVAIGRTLQLDVRFVTRYWVTLRPRTLQG